MSSYHLQKCEYSGVTIVYWWALKSVIIGMNPSLIGKRFQKGLETVGDCLTGSNVFMESHHWSIE